MPANATYLLPIYDEFLIAYKDRGPVAGPRAGLNALAAAAAGIPHHLLVAGRLTGGWARAAGSDSLAITVVPWRPLSRAEIRQVNLAADRFGAFVGLPVTTTVRTVRASPPPPP